MDFSVCNSCSSLSRKSTMYAVFAVTLIMSSVHVSSVKLPEQDCQPRPVVLGTETNGHRPYHISLHRCSGTCDETISPLKKPCKASRTVEISVDVIDPTDGEKKTIKVTNHTSCTCDCGSKCNWHEGEIVDEVTCGCIIPPTVGKREGEPNTEDVLPYKIGLFLMAFVILCVVVFEMTMCAKRKKFLERVKESCCKREEQMGSGNAEVTTV